MKKIIQILLFILSYTTIGAQTIIRGPYMTVPTSTSITIQWRTSTASNSEVKYGTTVGSLGLTTNSAASVTDHSITLIGLNPNTKYYYSIGKIGSALQGTASNNFYTAPINNSSNQIKFWVTGDFGNGSTNQANVRDAFTSYIGGEPVGGWIWLGDNAYSNGTDAEYQTKVFDVYTTIFKSLPVFPALGNHDYQQAGYLSATSRGISAPYFNIFSLPTNGDREKYYSTNYGNIHLIALDSYGSYNNVGSPMYNWLQSDLAANTQLWTVVYFHHPPYSKGGHNSDSSTELVDMRTNIIPLLESYGVDVVLSGHSHAYERSFFLKNHFGLENTFNPVLYPAGHKVQLGSGFPTPYTKSTRTGNGTVYVVCGVSGQVGGTSSGYPHNAMQYSTSTTNGSLILTINGNTLNCKFLTSSGNIDDQFTIVKNISTLPIKLVYFNSNINSEGNVDITWLTASEINNDYFTIERTQDFESIKSIGVIPGAGNSTTTLNYVFTDFQPINGISYYRLKQTDYDGNYSYSDWGLVQIGKNSEIIIDEIYPNPTKSNINISYINKSAVRHNLLVEIFNILGSNIYTSNRSINGLEQNVLEIKKSELKLNSGIYFITIKLDEIEILYNGKIMIQ